MTIRALGLALTGPQGPPDDLEIADILWLALHLPQSESRSTSPDQPAPVELPARRKETTPARPATPPAPQPLPPPVDEVAPSSDTGGIAIGPVQSPVLAESEAPALLYAPHQLAQGIRTASEILLPAPDPMGPRLPFYRALRPIHRKVRSNRKTVVDDENTARSIADQPSDRRIWMPVFRAAMERPLELMLVVDCGPSMQIWQQLTYEFGKMLISSGAFRRPITWQLQTDGPLRVRRRGERQWHQPSVLAGQSRRCVTLVLSDCTSPAWRSGSAAAALASWAKHGPVAIMHPLPARMWRRTAATTITAMVGATVPYGPNDSLSITPFDGIEAPSNGTPIPVMEFSAGWLGRWTRMVSGAATEPSAVAYFAKPRRDESAVRIDGDAHDRVARFRALASSDAFRLGGYLAMTEPWLPVMRYLQLAMLGSAGPSILAEVVLSGLLEADNSNGGQAADGRFRFAEGVIPELLDTLSESEIYEVESILRRVADAIQQRIGHTNDEFSALANIGHDVAVSPAARPFALVSLDGQRRLRMLANRSRPILKPVDDRRRFRPSELIDPHRAVVPFTDHQPSFDALRLRIDSGTDSIVVVAGPIGVGKTRTLVELCKYQRSRGWRAEFLAEDGALPSIDTRPTLLVVDDADLRRPDVASAVAWQLGSSTPARLVLLARSANNWWSNLLGEFAHLRTARVEILSTSFGSGREAHYQLAVRSFATALAASSDLDWRAAANHAEQSATQFRAGDSCFDIQVTALHRLLTFGIGPASGASTAADSLLTGIIEDERRYWRRSASMAQIPYVSAGSLGLCVAATGLYGAESGEIARSTVEAVLAVTDEARAPEDEIAAWLHNAYPGDSDQYWGSIGPPVAAGRLVIEAIRQAPRLLVDLLPTASDGQAIHAFSVLARAESDISDLAHHLDIAIEGDPARLVPLAAQAVANAETGVQRAFEHTFVRAISSSSTRTSTLRTVVDNLTNAGEVLQRLDLDGLVRAAVGYRRLSSQFSDYQANLAEVLSLLSKAQLDAGQTAEALATTTEVVGLYELLAEARPDEYSGLLGQHLLQQADILADEGRMLDALLASRKSVTALRRDAQNAPVLARALEQYSGLLEQADRGADALAAIADAVAVTRTLPDSGSLENRSLLASVLWSYGGLLAASRRFDEALTTLREVADVHRNLAAEDSAFAIDLAEIHLYIAITYIEAGRPRESIPYSTEAISLLRHDSAGLGVRVAMDESRAHGYLGRAYFDLGDFEESASEFGLAVGHMTELDRNDAQSRSELAHYAIDHADALRAVGRSIDAIAALRPARDRLRSLPEEADRLSDVLLRIAQWAQENSLTAEAVDAVLELVELTRRRGGDASAIADLQNRAARLAADRNRNG